MSAVLTEPMLLCPGCGYDLRGIESERCPECGVLVDRAGAVISRIPWAHREQIGKWRAYWRTVRRAMFHPVALAAEVSRPVRFDDAKRFSRRTALLAWATLVPLILWAWAATMKFPVVYRRIGM